MYLYTYIKNALLLENYSLYFKDVGTICQCQLQNSSIILNATKIDYTLINRLF